MSADRETPREDGAAVAKATSATFAGGSTLGNAAQAGAGSEKVAEPIGQESRPSFRTTALIASACITVLMVAVLAVILFAFVRIISIAEKSRDDVVPAVLRHQEQAVMAVDLARVAEMILGARDRQERADALDEAEGIVYRFGLTATPALREKLDTAVHAIRQGAYRADVQDALSGTITGHLARIDALLPTHSALSAGEGHGHSENAVGTARPEMSNRALTLLFEYRLLLSTASMASSATQLDALRERIDMVLEDLALLVQNGPSGGGANGGGNGGGRGGLLSSTGRPVSLDSLREASAILTLRREYLLTREQVKAETVAARRLLAEFSGSLSADASATASQNAVDIVTFGRNGIVIAFAALAFGLAVMAAAAFVLLRHIVSPVLRAHDALNAVQAGQTAVHVPAASLREFHAIGQSVERLGELLAEIKVKEQAALRSQEQLRFIFDVSPVPMVMSNMETSWVVNANKAACALFKVDPNNYHGRLAREFWVQPRQRDDMIDFLQREGGVDNFEAHMLTAVGTDFWARTSARPVMFDGQAVVLMAFSDITDQKTYETRLHGLVQELEASNRDLEQFAYAASHDLQEPIRLIMSYLQLIDRKNGQSLSPEGREFLAFATDAARRMQRLIVGLLDYARVGRSPKPPAVFSLDKIVSSVIDSLRAPLEEHGGVIEVQGSLPELFGDDVAFERVFQNVLGNAVKYRALDRDLKVVVKAKQNGNEWDITIADNGVGIPAEHAERVFQIFQRLHAHGNDYTGAGIGLAICRKILTQHGGRIWLDTRSGCDRSGQGCTVHISLPL